MKLQSPRENKSEKGLILLTSVIILTGIILILIVGAYLSINAIRWQIFSLPRESQSFLNAENCLAIAISKLKINPAYNTEGDFKEGISCQYLIEEENGKKIIKSQSSLFDFFKKILVELETVKE
jgi:hypothetical protein